MITYALKTQLCGDDLTDNKVPIELSIRAVKAKICDRFLKSII